MWKKIKAWCWIPESTTHSVIEDYERAEAMSNPNQAQHIVNRALAMYCEICDKGFAHTGLAKNHKRLAHKNL